MAELCFVEWIHEILAEDPFSHFTTHIYIDTTQKSSFELLFMITCSFSIE